jgi:hypothetical protein
MLQLVSKQTNESISANDIKYWIIEGIVKAWNSGHSSAHVHVSLTWEMDKE